MRWECGEEQEPVRQRIASFEVDGITPERRVEDNGCGQVSGSVSAQQQSGEGIGLFTNVEWRSAAESLIKDDPTSACAASQRHVAPQAHSAKGGDFEPLGVAVAEGAWSLLGRIRVGIGSDDLSGGCGDSLVVEGLHEDAQPVRRRNSIVVEVGHDVGLALGQARISRAAQSPDRFNNIARPKGTSHPLGFFVAFGVVNDENLIGRRIEPDNSGKALLQKRGAVSRADDNGYGQGFFLAL